MVLYLENFTKYKNIIGKLFKNYNNKQLLVMLRPIDNYFLNKNEPEKSCLQFLREYILSLDSKITEAWKYGMPFYTINGKMFCYLWTHKKYLKPYIGIVEGKLVSHPELLSENRSRMKILLLDPNEDLPLEKINLIMTSVLKIYN